MLKEFKEFALKGNMMDMAVGIIIGAAFGAIIKSLVDDVLMPVIGLLVGDIDFTTLVWGPMNIGLFLNAIVAFIIIAFVLFMIIKGMNNMKRKEEEKPAEPETPPAQEVLLQEIRDLLKKK
jgi:large conductance mechanosensitive channel